MQPPPLSQRSQDRSTKGQCNFVEVVTFPHGYFLKFEDVEDRYLACSSGVEAIGTPIG